MLTEPSSQLPLLTFYQSQQVISDDANGRQAEEVGEGEVMAGKPRENVNFDLLQRRGSVSPTAPGRMLVPAGGGGGVQQGRSGSGNSGSTNEVLAKALGDGFILFFY